MPPVPEHSSLSQTPTVLYFKAGGDLLATLLHPSQNNAELQRHPLERNIYSHAVKTLHLKWPFIRMWKFFP